jgi:hypothetical protein
VLFLNWHLRFFILLSAMKFDDLNLIPRVLLRFRRELALLVGCGKILHSLVDCFELIIILLICSDLSLCPT